MTINYEYLIAASTTPFKGTIVSNGIIHDELVSIVSPDRR
ncbi:hypothetical protein L336_0042 [Candidatus Saccharimonas aalborgensis]|uniref:Uncharacterized protein n=1 Tax=Candidatus Saccharimonas aalborgensis TaxID=1332188 RepID=R4PJV1_9BACT|nr:hypothetical protein L336_0042 [Candidatus Saccharimonas aalborgensis]